MRKITRISDIYITHTAHKTNTVKSGLQYEYHQNKTAYSRYKCRWLGIAGIFK